jgi:uncharacterized protein YcnI
LKSYSKTVVLFFLILATNLAAAQGTFKLSDWPAVDAALKPIFVKAIIEQAGVNKVKLKLPISFYQLQLEGLAGWSKQHSYSDYLSLPVAQQLATLAVIHCDWDNGVAPYEFAQKYLGAEQLTRLSDLYAEPIARLKNNCLDAAINTGAN